MKKKIRNFFETGVILTILFALVIQGVATTESTLSEEILGFFDAEFEWVPVYGDGLHTIVGDEIVLHEVPQLVTLEIYVSGWSPSLLKTLQATVDSAGYSNGVGGTLVPFGWPGSPVNGCFIDTSRPDYMFYGMAAVDAVHTGDLDYKWGATLLFGTKADGAQTYYLGTLIIEVPSNADGTYTIDFIPGNTKTFMTDDVAQFISPLTLTPAFITIDVSSNNPPNKPSITAGPTSGVIDVEYMYTAVATDPDNDWLAYRFDFGNTMTGWTSYTGSGVGNWETNIWSVPGTYQVKAQAKDIPGAISSWSNPLTVTISPGVNQPPNKPSTPSGPANGDAGTTYTYTSSATDPDGDSISYLFEWGDDTDSGWTDPIPSGQTATETHKWSDQGNYEVKVKARDVPDLDESEWSDPLSVTMPKGKPINTPFLKFLENHPHLFPLLRQLLGL